MKGRRPEEYKDSPAEASTNAENDEEEAQRSERTSSNVSIVLDSVDQEHQEGTGDEFGEELTGLGHEVCRICAENACGGSRAADGSNVRTTLVDVNGGFVVGVDNGRRSHSTENLGDHVGEELSPWELAEDAVGQSDSRVQVSTGDTT